MLYSTLIKRIHLAVGKVNLCGFGQIHFNMLLTVVCAMSGNVLVPITVDLVTHLKMPNQTCTSS